MCDCNRDPFVVEYKPINAGTNIYAGKPRFSEETMKTLKSVLDIVQITVLITGAIILLILFVLYLFDACKCKEADKFLTGYDLELELFTKMNNEERQEYLNMPRDKKLEKYPQLI